MAPCASNALPGLNPPAALLVLCLRTPPPPPPRRPVAVPWPCLAVKTPRMHLPVAMALASPYPEPRARRTASYHARPVGWLH